MKKSIFIILAGILSSMVFIFPSLSIAQTADQSSLSCQSLLPDSKIKEIFNVDPAALALGQDTGSRGIVINCVWKVQGAYRELARFSIQRSVPFGWPALWNQGSYGTMDAISGLGQGAFGSPNELAINVLSSDGKYYLHGRVRSLDDYATNGVTPQKTADFAQNQAMLKVVDANLNDHPSS